MPTLVHDPQPAEFEALLERRRRLGQDLFDEVWEGVLHMNPAPSGRHGDLESQLHVLLSPLAKHAGLRMRGQFNLGQDSDYRVPDDLTIGYFFHPFRGETLDAVLDDIIGSIDRNPRRVSLSQGAQLCTTAVGRAC